LGRVILIVGGICLVIPGGRTDAIGIALIALGYFAGIKLYKPKVV
jgi:UPF0716 family protein affecting phage T7 exclusion